MNKPKMTNIEKKQFFQLQTAKKESQLVRKKLSTTLNWLDIDNIISDGIILKNKMMIKGIKVKPHNIFLDDMQTQMVKINEMRTCFNSINEQIYIGIVQSKVNLDKQLEYLNDKLYLEGSDIRIASLYRNDINKIESFIDNFKEVEFFIMIRDDDEEKLYKNLNDLFACFKTAGFQPEYLNKKDLFNYINFVFENSTINDYTFSRGILSYLNKDMVFDEDKHHYKVVDNTENFEDYGEAIINEVPSANMILKSKLAPTAFSEHDRYVEIGDKYASFIIVNTLPNPFRLGIISDWLHIPYVKIFMTSTVMRGNITSYLRKDYQSKLREMNNTTDPTRQKKLEEELISYQEYINSCIKLNDKTHNVTIVFGIYANNLDELAKRKADFKDVLSSSGLDMSDCFFVQQDILKMVTPLFIKSELPKIIQERLGVALTSIDYAQLYPFIFDTLKDEKGYLLGFDQQSGGVILFDPFFYLNEKKQAVKDNRINGNMIILGKSGAGKTTAMNQTIRNFIENKIRTIWIDPENKNKALTLRYGGTFFDWGKGENIINVFDLKPISTDDEIGDGSSPEEKQAYFNKKWDTKLAIYNVIEDVKTVFSYLYPDIKDNALALIGDLVISTYRNVGIDINGHFNSLKKDDMPTFTDFNEALKTRLKYEKADNIIEILSDLSLKMKSILNEWSIYLNGHTTISSEDTEREIISFGTKKLFNADERVQNAMYHIMFTYAWSLCLDESKYSAFVIDEAHTMILKGKISKVVEQFFRRSRKYNNVMLLGTQEPRDFADERYLTSGKAMFNNSVYKLIMGLNQDAVNDVAKLENINENETMMIQQFEQGQGLFICGNRRIPVAVLVTQQELSDMQ